LLKICSFCREEKDGNEFFKNKREKDGRQRICKLCSKEYGKKYNKIYYENNKAQLILYKKQYYIKNRDYSLERDKKYGIEHKEHKKEYDKEYTLKNKEKIKNYNKSFALYNIYAHQISYAEEVRKDSKDEKLLQVKCIYCDNWFNPTINSIQNRIKTLNGKRGGGSRLYCSEECKQLCSIYKRSKYPKGQKPSPISRDMQNQWAEMVKERDGYKCVKCGETDGLIAHHREGILWNPLESADIDMGITLCKRCEKEVHSSEGCSYYDMRCV